MLALSGHTRTPTLSTLGGEHGWQRQAQHQLTEPLSPLQALHCRNLSAESLPGLQEELTATATLGEFPPQACPEHRPLEGESGAWRGLSSALETRLEGSGQVPCGPRAPCPAAHLVLTNKRHLTHTPLVSICPGQGGAGWGLGEGP